VLEEFAMPRWRHAAATALAVALLALAACGGDSDDEAGQQADSRSVTVTAREFSFEATQQSAAAGRIAFSLQNRGSVEHELLVVRSELAADKLPAKDGVAQLRADDELAHVHGVGPGQRRTTRVELARGRYLLICNVPTHYQSGMRLEFTVE
jgi:uncharacterized cupredoxin-like copper-binding protein